MVTRAGPYLIILLFILFFFLSPRGCDDISYVLHEVCSICLT